jgi:type II secretory pathway component PulK
MKIQFLKKARAGIALIIVMISIFVLTILAGGFAYSMKVETQLAMHANDETELHWIGRSGVEYCRWILSLQMACPNEPYDAENQIWAGGQGGPCATNGLLQEVQQEVKVGRGSFTWKMRDAERKWNINTVNEQILQNAMLLMGVDAGNVTPVVNSILDWIDPDDAVRVEGTESQHYQMADPPYTAKNGPIDSITELLLINHVTSDLYWGAASTNNPMGYIQRQLNQNRPMTQPTLLASGLVDLFTPISSGRININTASAEALQLIPGMNEMLAEQFVQARTGDFDPMSGTGGPFLNTQPQYLWSRVPGLTLEVGRSIQMFGDVRSRTFEVEITVKTGHSSRVYHATIVRNAPRDLQVVDFYWNM